jgi:chemotaxis protein MotB
MSMTRSRRRGSGMDYWPGFVDMLSTLLLVVVFLLSLFMLTNYFVQQEASGKDTALARLATQISQLTELLALERSSKKSVEDQLASLSATLAESQADAARLQGLLDVEGGRAGDLEGKAGQLATELDAQKKLSGEALARVELLNQQLNALRRQIAALEQALEASEARDRESQTKIADLGQRLNVALARKVQELARYRSDFFGKLREILGDREDVRIVGDRFVFQSEVLFDSGSAEIKPEARSGLDRFASALIELEKQIPDDIAWVLRVDGHTAVTPISSADFASNWELSAARAIAVVQELMAKGVNPTHLVAAGFGEHQPLDAARNADAFRQNRRIELKLTER